MKKRYILLLLFSLVLVGASAQTLEQAKAFYNKGQYEKAKPVFKKFVRTQPANGNYNLWYGVCCLETGEPDVALKYLETAVKKRIPSGQLYLARNYNDLYRFEDAIKCYEEYISDLSKRKRSTAEAEKLLEKSKTNLRMLKGIEEVCIIDSIVVDKDRFLEAYKISPESGKLFTYNDFFQNKEEVEATVYETELGNKIYYGERQPDGKLSILARNKMQGEWSKGSLLPGSINDSINANYPYVLTDGATIYYAADGENSIGGYDIFVTRYDSESSSYLRPDNIGMPFNSPANDYMYVIDELNNLGWFASDRYQPEDKVCIYVFVPNETKVVYDYENTDPTTLKEAASLRSIRTTWKDTDKVRIAKQKLAALIYAKDTEKKEGDFLFIIDDSTVYHTLNDFRSTPARAAYQQVMQKQKDYDMLSKNLEEKREQYAQSNRSQKKALAPGILDLEKRTEQLLKEIEKLTLNVRNEEIKKLKH